MKARKNSAAPANGPMTIKVDAGRRITAMYDGRVVTSARWRGRGVVRTMTAGGGDRPLDQVWTVTALEGTVRVELVVRASDESFPCEADRTGEGALPVVRHSFGVGVNRLNRAVYDRRRDWVLSIDPGSARMEVTPGALRGGVRSYRITAEGSEIILRFRPRFYQKHRGLKFYRPWTYRVNERPVVGWCSWFAYFQDVDEGKVHAAADALARELGPFGLEYIQIDDGFEQTPVAGPESWLTANKKFPGGLAALADYIHGKGLKAGLWSAPMVHDTAWAEANAELFVKDASGGVAKGRWIGHAIDGSSPRVHERYLSPMYGGLAAMGWDYFKVDSIRHLRYEGYNGFAEFFNRKRVDRERAYRRVFKTIRRKIGGAYLLACWGIRPEIIGLADGCRIGDDGFAFAGLSQFNSWNNVVWRNDPDHIVLSPEEAYRSTMTTSLTGSLFMVTDKAERYAPAPGGDLEAARRTIPVLFTRPGQLFDVDPSRSDELGRVESEVSGSGPRPFDASRLSTTGLFQLDLNLPYESWTVLGRTDGRERVIPLRDLGLEGDAEYLAYEFWGDKFLGKVKGELVPGEIDGRFGCQAFCLRRLVDRPQLLATRRHISCGALEVSELSWRGCVLRGVSRLVEGDAYRVLVHEPAGWKLTRAEAKGAKVVRSGRRADGLREIVMEGGGEMRWMVGYEKKAGK